MKFYKNMKVDMLKIVLITVGYTMHNFTSHITIL